MTTPACLPSSASRGRLARLAAASVLALSLSAAPALAAEEAAETGDEATTATEGHGEEEGGGKIELAEGPRDRVGLIVLAFFGAITVGGAMTASRQLRGTRPQASGEFRWR